MRSWIQKCRKIYYFWWRISNSCGNKTTL